MSVKKPGRRANQPVIIPAGYKETLASQFLWTALVVLEEKGKPIPGDCEDIARLLNISGTCMAFQLETVLHYWRLESSPRPSTPPPMVIGVGERDVLRLEIPIAVLPSREGDGWSRDLSTHRERQLASILQQVTAAYNQLYDSGDRAVIRSAFKVEELDKVRLAVLSHCFHDTWEKISNEVPDVKDWRTARDGARDVLSLLRDYLTPIPSREFVPPKKE